MREDLRRLGEEEARLSAEVAEWTARVAESERRKREVEEGIMETRSAEERLRDKAVIFRRELTVTNIRSLTPKNWGLLGLSAFLSSALTPGLFFYAIANTSVTNVVLISRIEPPLFLLASWLILHERFSRRAMSAWRA